MQYIDIETLNKRLPEIKASYQSKEPFKYVMFENFFPSEIAESIHDNYPEIDYGKWDGKTYVDQKNKFQNTKFEKGSQMDVLFNENDLHKLNVDQKFMVDHSIFVLKKLTVPNSNTGTGISKMELWKI